MACVTLKRSLDLEPLYSPPHNVAKRRRCAPLTPLFSRRQNSTFSGKRKDHGGGQLDLETKRIFGADCESQTREPSGSKTDAFLFKSCSGPNKDEIYKRIRDEWKRLKRRGQVKYLNPRSHRGSNKDNGGSSSSSDNDESSPMSSPRVSFSSFDNKSSSIAKTAPSTPSGSRPVAEQSGDSSTLFTLDQVCMICNKLLVDRENALREEYDKALHEKLAEQYDAFVKFTHDQIQTKFSQSTPSYLS